MNPPDYLQQCVTTLEEALAHVEAYQSWRHLDRGPASPVDERYAGLPALTKREMTLLTPRAFVTPGLSIEQGLARKEIELVATSGSTEDKVVNVWFQQWWNASETASWALNTAAAVATGDHPEAILSNPLNVGIVSERGDLPFERRRVGRFLYLNDLVDPLGWPDSHYDRMLAELERYKPKVLEANPSLLSRLCRYVLRTGRRVFQPALIVLTYEFPSAIHRRHFRAIFDAPIMSSYGTTEAGYVFTECEHGRMHQNTAFCRADHLPFKPDCGGPALGRLLVTTFGNPWRALLRFDVGDLGRLAAAPCPCGRSDGLTLEGIEGRTVNLTVTPDGLPVTQAQVDERVAAVAGIDEYELRQTGRETYRLRVACDRGFGSAIASQARAVLVDLYGAQAQVKVEEAYGLSPEISGKYRLAMAEFPIDSAAFLDPQHIPPPVPR